MATPNHPRLQIAQILADLSDLQAADPSAAHALVTANHHLAKPSSTSTLTTATGSITKSRPSNPNLDPNLKRPTVSTSTSTSSSTSTSLASLSRPQTLSREPSLKTRSRPADESTDQDPDPDLDPDLARATTLLSLYEDRGKAKLLQQGENAGLVRARRVVEGVSERYARYSSTSGGR